MGVHVAPINFFIHYCFLSASTIDLRLCSDFTCSLEFLPVSFSVLLVVLVITYLAEHVTHIS